ncbi:MAG: bifunctional phosphopantothenoylcysteine decarboxylase/phosphopantothenate--cysteine ligase CoaBC, partial [Bdellovibrio sp.]|nr:bifunctional phosphopantothenoylcysteine decarboxylase/phosphopantothenate--cysteine ligase CoaBC [Methylotenera sp.]
LSSLCLARDCPLLVAPAMNKQMWENPATQRNFAQLIADKITVLGPGSGDQACGEVGLGRMLEADELMADISGFFTPKLLAGKRVLITAGATLEMIDPVRAITNLSSGKMGYALAQAAADMGAMVTLISGATALTPPKSVTNISATSAEKMYQAVMSHIKNQDIFIAVAAVADYTPARPSAQKMKKIEQANNNNTVTIELTPTKDILKDVASLPNAPFCMGFAAESERLIEYASAKRIAKKLPLIVANHVSAMKSNENTVTLIDDAGAHAPITASKVDIATVILKHVAKLMA